MTITNNETDLAAATMTQLATMLRAEGYDAEEREARNGDETDAVIVGAVELRWDDYSDEDNPGWLAVYGDEQVAVDTLDDVLRAVARGNR